MPYFRAVEKALATLEYIGDSRFGQGLFVVFRLRVDAIQNGDFAQWNTSGFLRGNALNNGRGFLQFVGADHKLGRLATIALGLKCERRSALGGCSMQDGIGRCNDLWRRPVVANQRHLTCVREALRERFQVL